MNPNLQTITGRKFTSRRESILKNLPQKLFRMLYSHEELTVSFNHDGLSRELQL